MKPVHEMTKSEVLAELPTSTGERRHALCDEAAANFLKRRLREWNDPLETAVRQNSAGGIVRAIRK